MLEANGMITANGARYEQGRSLIVRTVHLNLQRAGGPFAIPSNRLSELLHDLRRLLSALNSLNTVVPELIP